MSTLDQVLAGGIIMPRTEIISALAGRVLAAVPITQGEVIETATGEVLGRLRLTVPASPEWLPLSPSHPLAAYGQELTVRRGFDGVEGREHLGTYRILPAAPPADGYLEIDAVSIDSRLSSARLIGAMVTTGTAKAQILALCDGVLDVQFLAASAALADREWPAEQDRRAAVLEICTAIGAVMRIRNGRLAIVPAPTGTAPARTITTGPGGTITGLAPSLSQDITPNAVIAVAASTGGLDPAAATALINTGARRWSGPYGQVPAWVTSPLLETTAQCAIAAQTELARLQSGAPDLEVSAVTDPRTRLDTVLRVVAAGTDCLARVTQVTHALTPGQEPGKWQGQVLSGTVQGVPSTAPYTISVLTSDDPPPAPPSQRQTLLRPTWTGTYRVGSGWKEGVLKLDPGVAAIGAAWWGDLPAGITDAEVTLQTTYAGPAPSWTPTLALLAGTEKATPPIVLATATGPVLGRGPVRWSLPGTWIAQMLSGAAGGIGLTDGTYVYGGLSGTGVGMSLTVTTA